MALTLADLVTPRTAAQWAAQLYAGLQGLGYVAQKGTGTGKITVAGNPAAAFDVVITIKGTGELGAATFVYQLTDAAGVVTVSSLELVPAGGGFALPGTACTITFVAGPTGDSFVAGDTYAFRLITPTMPITSWQDGGVGRTFVENFARAVNDLDQLAATLAAAGLLTQAPAIDAHADAWLDLIAKNMYGLDRVAAVTTRGTLHLVCAAGAGPYTLNPGDVWVSDVGGHRFTNVTGGTLPSNGTLDITIQAERPGQEYNLGNGSITILQTALAGVTVSNPDPGSGTWITRSGADQEANASLVQRCQARWPGLGGGATAAVYEAWARAASADVTRVRVFPDQTIPGQVDVYLANAGGGVSGGTVSAVQADLNKRVPLTTVAAVASAAAVPVTVTATIWVKAAQLASAQATITAALAAYVAGLPIGGDVAAGPGGICSREMIVRALTDANGVVDASVTAPGADVALTATQVATLTQSLTWVTV